TLRVSWSLPRRGGGWNSHLVPRIAERVVEVVEERLDLCSALARRSRAHHAESRRTWAHSPAPARPSAGTRSATAGGHTDMPAGASPSAWARSMWLALNGSHGVIASSIGTIDASCSIRSIHVIGAATDTATEGVRTASAVAIVTHRRTTRR